MCYNKKITLFINKIYILKNHENFPFHITQFTINISLNKKNKIGNSKCRLTINKKSNKFRAYTN